LRKNLKMSHRKCIKCIECEYLVKGFLSEPHECGWFGIPYRYFVNLNDAPPKWCPRMSSKMTVRINDEKGEEKKHDKTE